MGHILVEILLDATLIAAEPARLDQYYAAIESLDGQVVEDTVVAICGRRPQKLAMLIGLFCRERFLSDYLDDGKLMFRLNQVMRRVRLPQLPATVQPTLHDARPLVARRISELLAA